ncbi:hypothetical protein [Spirosoma radiotolerans]|uniref:Aerotolerance regulator N-terminal domain-containing protein n=1 Tax=Spirosoma radiotolerans TaxID=1379870 RepID=A0A0E3V8F9_9BACT|nr:hypothetical protein [Spirosoma radiotolerans]AKD56271.1 hypothetical protein SD10_16555 [Spirosoma radiotolerans]
MQTTINWTSPINWFIALALLILLVGQLWLISRNPSVSNRRKWVKAGLNIILWLLVAAYFGQLHWLSQRPSSHALLIGDDVPSAVARQVKDSLHIQDSFTSRNLKNEYDSVTLVGQRFPIETLTKLSNSSVNWVPYTQPDQLASMHWKGIVRQGEIQRVTGRVHSSEKQLLRLRFGSRTLDSISVHEGDNVFSLQFPAFVRGRSQAELMLGGTTLDTIRFFARPTEPLNIQFLLDSPDFESNTLAGWLGKQGHTVQVITTLSKSISSNVSINKAGKSVTKTTPDLLITDPANAANAIVKKALAEGKAVLFLNFTKPEIDCQLINKALGSQWQVRKVSSEPVIPVGNGLNALPYRFADNLNQFTVTGYPVAVQRKLAGRIGASLLSETFPLSLSGDTVTYSRLWTAVLARLSPTDKNTIQVDAPLFSGLKQAILINNEGTLPPSLLVGQDTVAFVKSPINEHAASGSSLFRQAGWQAIQDSLALYVDARTEIRPLAEQRVVQQFISAHAQYQSTSERAARTTTSQVPNWLWLALIVCCFTALWVEPKVL